MAVLMFVDGVLRNAKKAPIQQGMLLYHALKEKNRKRGKKEVHLTHNTTN
mgnify:CR=1 FL=1